MIMLKYSHIWDFSLPRGDDISKITATMKRAGIINLLVVVFVLPESCLDKLERHSGRLSSTLTPPQQLTRIVSSRESTSTEEVEEKVVVESGEDPREKARTAAIQSLWKSSMKRLLDEGEYREAGLLHVAACIARQESGDRMKANALIENLVAFLVLWQNLMQ